MPTLLLRLAGPMQSWGTESKFEIRRTGNVTSKSGVIGLLASALGRGRDASLDDLAAMRFGVRADQEGRVTYDYQIARPENTPYITKRYYIEDAVFLAGFESEDEKLLKQLDHALRNPKYFLSLGRRSYVPSVPIVIGIREASLEDSLRSEPWLVSDWRQKLWRKKNIGQAHPRLRMVIEDRGSGSSTFVRDVPVSFDPHHREFAVRAIKEMVLDSESLVQTEHDAFSALEDDNVSDKN